MKSITPASRHECVDRSISRHAAAQEAARSTARRAPVAQSGRFSCVRGAAGENDEVRVFRLDDPDRRWDDVLSLDADDGASPAPSLAAVPDDGRRSGHGNARHVRELPAAPDRATRRWPAALVLHLRLQALDRRDAPRRRRARSAVRARDRARRRPRAPPTPGAPRPTPRPSSRSTSARARGCSRSHERGGAGGRVGRRVRDVGANARAATATLAEQQAQQRGGPLSRPRPRSARARAAPRRAAPGAAAAPPRERQGRAACPPCRTSADRRARGPRARRARARVRAVVGRDRARAARS